MTEGPPTAAPIPATVGRGPTGAAPWRSRLVAAALIGGAGGLMVIAGTFLPWVSSGGRGRNIYKIIGLADKLGLFEAGPWRAVPVVVPLLGPACLLPAVLAILRLRRAAATTAIVIGLLSVVLGAATMLLGRGTAAMGVHLQPLGPAVLLTGGVLLAAAGMLALGRPGPRTGRG